MRRRHATEAMETFWKVEVFDAHHRIPPAERYWFDNRRRPEDLVVALVVLDGLMLYVDDEGQHEVRPGWATLFAHNEATAFGRPAGAEYSLSVMYASFSGAGMRDHWTELRRNFGSIFFLGEGSRLWWALRALGRDARWGAELGRRARPRTSASIAQDAATVHGFVASLYEHLEANVSHGKPPVQRAVDDLLRSPTYPWSLKEVATQYGCSREHLTRAFVQRTGVPPTTYLTRVRTEQALELLRSTTVPVGRIAEQTGFASHQALIRQVRMETGRTPRAIREKSRQAIDS